jgi:hypothetical protein
MISLLSQVKVVDILSKCLIRQFDSTFQSIHDFAHNCRRIQFPLAVFDLAVPEFRCDERTAFYKSFGPFVVDSMIDGYSERV